MTSETGTSIVFWKFDKVGAYKDGGPSFVTSPRRSQVRANSDGHINSCIENASDIGYASSLYVMSHDLQTRQAARHWDKPCHAMQRSAIVAQQRDSGL
eukprot:1158759-Pelagomonas_calceolata.AAC.5